MNHTFVKALRAVFVAVMMSLAGSHALAQGSGTGVHVMGNVYGGGNLAPVGGNVEVNMKAGTVEKDVYGGGALANTNINNVTSGYGTSSETISSTSTNTTTVNLTGGTIKGDAYGGGLGSSTVAALVYGDTKVNLNGMSVDEYNSNSTFFSSYLSPVDLVPDVAPAIDYYMVKTTDTKGCVVNRVFGCNNLKGTPKGNVTVHVYATQNKDASKTTIGEKFNKADYSAYTISNYSGLVTLAEGLNINVDTDKATLESESASDDAKKTALSNIVTAVEAVVSDKRYDVKAVYGGGNEAAYDPATPNTSTSSTLNGARTSLIIEGCDYTSIETVYGGGNAAPVPESNVTVNAAYEIGYVFGGGNGKDNKESDNSENLGADVGTIDYGSTTYGTGNATTRLYGGTIHEAYGGSNKRGRIIGNADIDAGSNSSGCDLDLGKMVGAGKNADINGDVIMTLGCKPSSFIPLLFAGADDANVDGNIELTITSGNFGQVFGGNNAGGIIKGYIKVNIEETGDCDTPINIDELYLGGNEAAYSMYGYYNAGNETSPDYRPRTLEMTDPEDTDNYQAPLTGRHAAPYAAPVLNVISCTRIGKVFGGGYGTGAKLYGDPIVNINMIQGSHYNDNTYGVPAKMTALGLPSTENTSRLGIIGDVYGGGNAADVVGNPTVNIGTASTVDLVSTGATGVSVVGAYIIGNVYGGGMGSEDTFLCEKAMIGVDGAGARDADGDGKLDTEGGTTVNIYKGLVRGNVYGGGQIGRVEKNTVVTIGDGTNDGAGTENGTPTPVIGGSVFGGGKGEEEHGYAALVRGNPTVTIQGNAKVLHSVYGGGEIASVARYNVPKTEAQVQAAIAAGYKEAKLGMPYALKDPNSGTCTVIVRGYAEIGPDGMQMTKTGGPDDTGYVFGAGKGILPGGDYEFKRGTTRRMVLYDAGVHTTVGQEGSKWQWVDPDHSDTNKNVWEYFATLDEYIAFIQTLALSSRTYVTITDNAFVKGSVYGGSENGIVQFDTDVKILSGQIGCGEGETGAHPDAYWTSNSEDPTKFAECASWLFKDPYAPYDPYAKYKKTVNGKDRYYYNEDCTEAYYAEGGAVNASDGHTFYGNVFGGGSGSVPYFDHTLRRSVYLHSAGQVKGNTNVTISGGHILTNVYGGCEATNVGETANVTMTGGTIGVPRTDDQIIAHPLTGYLFGGGKGDQRIFFNKDTNVKDAVVKVEGGRIYGSVYGGGEDGHVLRNVTLTIGKQTTTTGENNETVTTTSGPKIGTKGTSYYDGHVFGGGRGFGGDALTAGNVGGSVDVNILDGDILGSVYGGGRLASVGYGLYLVDEVINGVKPYGIMRPDNEYDGSYTNPSTEDAGDFFTKGRGHVTMTISGGTIGNDDEYAYDASNPISHTKGGNVFAGGMGRMYKLGNTTTPISSLDWWKLGNVKSTKLTISGNAKIKSCVYGGGELGMVQGGNHTSADSKTVSTEIIINGGTIGTEVTEKVNNVDVTQYTFGSVFGGGYGSLTEKLDHNGSTNPTYSTYKYTYPKYIAGRVKGSTEVTMTDGTVLASVYGGGEMAAVGESKVLSTSTDPVVLGETLTGNNGAPILANTYVTISGGTIGKEKVGTTYFGGAKMGNVYGGGSGHNNTVRSGHVYGNTNVTINAGSVSDEPKIYHNVYGGGAYGSVGDFVYTTTVESGVQKVSGITDLHTERTNTGTANVTITGGIIGYDGKENGMVFGSSRGDINQPGARDDHCAWVYDTHVTIGSLAEGTEGQEGYVPATAPQIKGSVYGSGENGHTFNDTEVIIHSGTVGIEDGWPINGLSGANYPTRGNVYGGGCGTDTYEVDHDNNPNTPSKQYFNRLSGIVRGNTSVTMDGGHVVRSIYGGGAMGSVGVFTRSDDDDDGIHLPGSITGISFDSKCTVSISGGKVGPATLTMPMNAGMVFGAGRGEVHDLTDYPNLERVVYVNETDVTISGTAFVKGSVYGGAESGHVFGDTHVTIDGDCQIGCGYDKTFNNGEGKEPGKDLDRVYNSQEWAYNVTADDSKFLYECNSWPFEFPYAPYDKFAKSTGYYDDAKQQTADNARPTGSDGHTFYGNVFGGGSGFEPYAPGKWLPTAGWVQGNTLVEIKGGHILTSVYGGNEMSDVGAGGVRKMTDLNHETSDMFYDITKPGGKCIVKMSGGTLGVPRTLDQIAAHPLTCYLFGAGKGDQRIFFNKTTNVKEVEIEISGGRIYGSVFGGGEDGHVMRDVKMTIKDGSTTTGEGEQAVTTTTSPIIGTWGTSYVDGNVFGGGRGFSGEALTAGNVGGSVNIDIQGGKMLGSIYGGGRLGSVGYGLYLVDEKIGEVKPYGDLRDDNVDDRGNSVDNFKRGYIKINISGGTIGNDIEYKYNPTDADKQKMRSTQFDYQNHLTYTRGGNVFTGCMGRLYALDNSTLLPLWTKLGRCKKTELNITGGMIKSNVYGGAELGVVQEDATVNITGGTVGTKVVDSNDETNYYYYGSVFGSGKGSNDAITYPEGTAEAYKKDISEAGAVEGNVTVELNKGVAESEENMKGGVVHKIFGCNDMNGTPKGTVTVHVYATQKEGVATINDKAAKAATAEDGTYDVEAVYGGGNLAAYVPTKAVSGSDAEKELARPEVIIDGCGLTSIGTVYGGGNAASVPATNVTVNGTYEIGQVFGGGNGKDKLPSGSDNPGANVGYYSYPNATNAAYDTKEDRIANYAYGSGKAHATIYGGTVHTVYGGSNTKGNVRVESRTTLEDHEECLFNVGDAFGGGNNAAQDGDAILDVGCIRGLDIAYGGASNADVNGDVILNITNGTYGRVFGGNNLGGVIRGSIFVNIEETGCNPIVIGELYCGGNEAAYSVYGYDDNGSVKLSGNNPVADPVLNVKSFTSIGQIFGGGYGEKAVMVGDPTVNINVCKGKYYNTFNGIDNVINDNAKVVGSSVTDSESDAGYATGYPIPSHAKGAIGAINDVFGGGNAAKVIGKPHVNIGTKVGEVIPLVSKPIEDSEGRAPSAEGWTPSYQLVTVEGVDIRGNVYGAGNNAQVTGDTEVVIGKNNDVKTYCFRSFGSESGDDAWSSGLAQTTGNFVTLNNGSKLAEVVILTNGMYGDFVGRKYYVASDAPTDGTRTELKDENGAPLLTPLYVSIKPFEQKKTYNFTSHSAENGGTQYSTGTAAPTGNFKTFGGTEYMQIQVLTNPGDTSWEGKTFYVPVNAETDGTTRTQLRNADGGGVGVWVSISEAKEGD